MLGNTWAQKVRNRGKQLLVHSWWRVSRTIEMRKQEYDVQAICFEHFFLVELDSLGTGKRKNVKAVLWLGIVTKADWRFRVMIRYYCELRWVREQSEIGRDWRETRTGRQGAEHICRYVCVCVGGGGIRGNGCVVGMVGIWNGPWAQEGKKCILEIWQ